MKSPTATVRLTLAKALVRHLASQFIEIDGVEQRVCAGGFAIFGHGNVAGIGHFLILTDRSARIALKRSEALDGIVVGGGLMVGIGLAVAGGLSGTGPLILAGGGLAAGSIPAARKRR